MVIYHNFDKRHTVYSNYSYSLDTLSQIYPLTQTYHRVTCWHSIGAYTLLNDSVQKVQKVRVFKHHTDNPVTLSCIMIPCITEKIQTMSSKKILKYVSFTKTLTADYTKTTVKRSHTVRIRYCLPPLCAVLSGTLCYHKLLSCFLKYFFAKFSLINSIIVIFAVPSALCDKLN